MPSMELSTDLARPQSRPAAGNDGFGAYFRYHGWLSPGVRLFRSLSFTAKSAWISAAFLAPLLTTLFYLWTTAQDQIDIARSEQRGLSYSNKVTHLIKAAQFRRLAATTNPAALPETQATLQTAFAEVEKQQQLSGKEFKLDGIYAKLRQLHEQLAATPVGADVQATYLAHSAYIDTLLQLNRNIADGSQLSLDPDLDTYHMMNIAVLRGPMLSEMTARLRGKGMIALVDRHLDSKLRDSMIEDGAVQQQLIADIRDSYEQGLAGDTTAASTMDIEGIVNATRAQREMLARQVLGAELGNDAQGYLTLSNKAVDMERSGQERISAELDQRLQARIDRISATLRTQFAISLVFVLLAAYLLLAFYKVMMGGLQEVSGHLEQITHGNLTTAPTPWGSDEAAELMNIMGRMQTSLRRMVGTVIDSSASVQVASEEIASASLDLSRRTEDAAASLEETAASLEEISATVRNTGDAVRNAAAIVNENAIAATRGGEVIAQVVSTMDDIQQSSRKIEEIISVIDGIAFQTNILALNAAVEAARAGEEGRGFAVVASEVRSLAHRSASAAKEIKELIGNSMEQVRAGNAIVAEAGMTITDIVANAKRIDQLMRDVAASTEEQANGVAQVNRAVAGLDEATQQNAALVEQTTAASSTLSGEAQKLNEEIAFFKIA